MKAVGPLLSTILVCACSAGDNYAVAAKGCVEEQLHHQTALDASRREVVAAHCAPQIRAWAIGGLQKAYGRPIDLQDTTVRQEYLDRQRAIIRLLMPLKGDPPKL